MNRLDNVIQVLSLVSTDKRKNTINNIVQYVLFTIAEPCSKEQINDFIETEFGITFFDDELTECIASLIDDGRLKPTKENKFELSANVFEELFSVRQISEEKRHRLYTEFEAQLLSLGGDILDKDTKLTLFAAFQEYLCECIYIYGRESTNLFKLKSTDITDKRLKLLSQMLLKIPNQRVRSVIRTYVQKFPEILTPTQAELINELIDKSEEFYSLGLSKEQAAELKSMDFLNWVFFLDTNVLYSVLDLHIHPENEACHKIIQIITTHSDIFKIRFTYLQKSHEELRKKRQVFENIPKTIYKESQIRAMLNQKVGLDSFRERYLQKMLQFGDDTPHPTESIDRHITILKNKSIEINRKDLSGVDTTSEHFTQLISDYKKVEQILNEAKFEKTQSTKLPKEIDKIEHDVFLREAIKRFRPLKPSNLNECKYFGLTLDAYLIKFDSYKLREERRESKTSDLLLPTFFKPSFLLSKLIKLLPVVTPDYKKAFVKALLTPTFQGGRSKANAIFKTVSRFNALGIEDESIILACITDDLFLREAEVAISSNDDELFSNALSEKIEKQIAKVSMENEALKEELMKHQREGALSGKTVESLNDQLRTIEQRFGQTAEELRVYKVQFEKIKNKKQVTSVASQQLNLIDGTTTVHKEKVADAQDGVQSATQPDATLIRVNWGLVDARLRRSLSWPSKVLSITNILMGGLMFIFGLVDRQNWEFFFSVATMEAVIIFVVNKWLKDSFYNNFLTQMVVTFLFGIAIYFNWELLRSVMSVIFAA